MELVLSFQFPFIFATSRVSHTATLPQQKRLSVNFCLEEKFDFLLSSYMLLSNMCGFCARLQTENLLAKIIVIKGNNAAWLTWDSSDGSEITIIASTDQTTSYPSSEVSDLPVADKSDSQALRSPSDLLAQRQLESFTFRYRVGRSAFII